MLPVCAKRRQSSAVAGIMSAGCVPQPGRSTVLTRMPFAASDCAMSEKDQGESPSPCTSRIPRPSECSGRYSFGRFASSSIFLPSSVSSTKLRLAPIHAFASAAYCAKLVWPSGITCLCASSSDGAAQLVTESRIEAARIPERTNMKDS